MTAQLTVLTPADIQRFERDGYVVVRQGDMVFCHPVMVHCAAPNRYAAPLHTDQDTNPRP